ncbi:nitroreductase [Robiginitomaculum antarcticum]|uniref:nitroreductase n=1 Tax=Robiginitomaculum antarcticum TaxID=437507 RepID=UPI000380D0A5|nr:nitroreductase [Robiginitomaculum antarcticum]
MTLNTTPSTDVTDALETRITVRAFLDKAVPDDMLRAILQTAMRSPSGGNLQPWKIHVMRGKTLAEFKADAKVKTLSGQMEEPSHPAYPANLWEPHRSWRYKLGMDMYDKIGVARDDKIGRMMWLANNATFFDAPVGLIITGDKRLEMPQHMDIGILIQSIMLLARESGLHTAPQGWWRNWPSVTSHHLDIDKGHEVLVGMAIGYGDPEARVNDLRADRAELVEVSKFYD